MSTGDDKFREEPLLEGCLDEVLGGRTPPDLTARILQAWAMRRQSVAASTQAGTDPNLLLPPLPGPALETLPLEIAPPGMAPLATVIRAIDSPPPVAVPGDNGFAPVRRSSLSGVTRSRSRKSNLWAWWMVAGCVAGLGVTLAIIASQSGPGTVVVKPNPKPDIVKPDILKPDVKPGQSNNQLVKPTPKQPGPMKPPPAVVQNNGPEPRPFRPGIKPDPMPEVRPPTAKVNVHDLVAKKYDQAISDAEMVSYINTTLAASWKANNVQPSPQASDEEWCRRVFVRLLGRIPNVDELRKFSSDKARDKREKLVAQLMEGEGYADQFASHWAGIWSNTLIGRTMTRDAEEVASRDGLEQYLRGSLAAKKPYYQIVYELLTAEGSAKPGSKDFNGAVNFLVASLGKDATLATARTLCVFLGQQLQCAQCHQHPTNNWGQHQYWAMNAFFRQARIEQVAGVTRLTNEDFVNRKNVTTEGEVYFEQPNGTIKATGPEFVDGTKIPASGRLDEVNRRQELAKLVVTSPHFGPALVNRLWAHYFGFGFTRPVDDIGPNNQPSHPELLAKVSEQFEAHNYDVRKVMKWLVLSDAFGRSSRITPNNLADAPEAGSAPLFTHYYTRQMQAEEVYNSLLIAGDLRKRSKNQRELETARVDWLAQFNRPMGTDDSEEESHFNGAMRQSLIMMNGDLMRRAVSSDDGSLLKHLQESSLKPEEKVEHLFLAALSRQPTRRELDAVKQLTVQHKGDAAAALEDIWWALLNSNEFILDH